MSPPSLGYIKKFLKKHGVNGMYGRGGQMCYVTFIMMKDDYMHMLGFMFNRQFIFNFFTCYACLQMWVI